MVIASLSVLAQQYGPPPGQPFNKGGEGFRHYALVVALHVAFVVGAARSRQNLLGRIAQIPLQARYDYEEMPPMVGYRTSTPLRLKWRASY